MVANKTHTSTQKITSLNGVRWMENVPKWLDSMHILFLCVCQKHGEFVIIKIFSATLRRIVKLWLDNKLNEEADNSLNNIVHCMKWNWCHNINCNVNWLYSNILLALFYFTFFFSKTCHIHKRLVIS